MERGIRSRCREMILAIDGILARVSELEQERSERPRVVCLSGSSRFVDVMAIKAWELEKTGVIVLGLHLLPAWYGAAEHHQAEVEGTAVPMDELHLRKIDLADEVLVMNVGGYIGDSTRRAIAYAEAHGKPITFLEPQSTEPKEGA